MGWFTLKCHNPWTSRWDSRHLAHLVNGIGKLKHPLEANSEVYVHMYRIVFNTVCCVTNSPFDLSSYWSSKANQSTSSIVVKYLVKVLFHILITLEEHYSVKWLLVKVSRLKSDLNKLTSESWLLCLKMFCKILESGFELVE